VADRILTPLAQRELAKAMDSCGRCRIKLDALADSGFPVDELRKEVEDTYQMAQRLIRIDDTQSPTR
jgi:hypothetical protein